MKCAYGTGIGSGPEFCNLAFSQAGEVKVVANGVGGAHAKPGAIHERDPVVWLRSAWAAVTRITEFRA
jgi:hypothetical protein